MQVANGHHRPADDVRRRLRQWRLRLLLQRALHVLAAIALMLLAERLLAISFDSLFAPSILLVGLSIGQLLLSRQWRRLTPDNFMQHLNRRFPDFEESAQLLLQDESRLSALQLLQRQRALAVYQQNLAQVQQWKPLLKYRLVMAVLTGTSALALFSDQLPSLASRFLPTSLPAVSENIDSNAPARIDRASVRVTPPAYSGREPFQTSQLDIELIEGSQVTWQLWFSAGNSQYALQLSGGRQIPLIAESPGVLSASASISKTALYRVINLDREDGQIIGDVYSLTVKLDQAPDIRIIEPDVSILEIPKNSPARFSSLVLVKDDYGVQTVDILASVARGSGEAVKFRDQQLDFQTVTQTDKGQLYQREWDLPALGMAPGDEVYFTVIATDNKQPEANSGRSAAVIVRWLDDEQTGLAAEGLAIDFIPEFFKSQRQLIIDTEQLLEDQGQLEDQTFKNSAYAIGQAQADLKQKYGQYLGDEFAEGAGTHAATETTEHDGHDEQHASGSSDNEVKSVTSTAEILKFFGHDHGDPDIGPITQRNPVALMKRAVNEMWQAEKHLMQAEPQLALPFEYEAYQYLKLARQADRIYVKRLGFEPPPVSEERRLSGELDDILSYQLNQPEQLIDAESDTWFQILLIDSYQIVSKQSLYFELSINERKILSELSNTFTTRSQSMPALIQQAATIEKLLLTGLPDPGDCENCVVDLRTTLWNLLDGSTTRLHRRKAQWLPTDGLIQSYQRALLSNDTAIAPDSQINRAGDQP